MGAAGFSLTGYKLPSVLFLVVRRDISHPTPYSGLAVACGTNRSDTCRRKHEVFHSQESGEIYPDLEGRTFDRERIGTTARSSIHLLGARGAPELYGEV